MGWAAVALATAALALAWFADWRLRAVTTPSMAPVIAPGSLAVVVPRAPQEVRTGEVIVFRDPMNRAHQVMHRVIARVRQPDGRLLFRTQGDGNLVPDAGLVATTDLIGRVRWHIPHLGTTLGWLRPPHGALVLIGMPAVLALATGRRQKRQARVDRRSFDILPVRSPRFVL